MPKMIDHDRIARMAICQCPVPTIAHRLKISTKTVTRSLKSAGISAPTRSVVGTSDEWRLWVAMKERGETDTFIAFSFGFSRQYINQFFKSSS